MDDQVWSWNEETNEKSLKKVTNLFTNLTTKWTLVEVGNETIKCTSNHPFLIQDVNEKTPIVEFEDYESKNRYGSFVESKDLTAGMKVLLSNGRTDIILSVKDEELNEPIATYNFEVEDFHTYYVGESGVLVHNTCQVTAPNGKELYRGGDNLIENLADDIVVKNSMVQPGGGPSINTSLKFADKISGGRGAFTLDHIPDGLGLLQTGSKGHYIILLKSIKLTPFG